MSIEWMDALANNKCHRVCLCERRHDYPANVSTAVYPQILSNPIDFIGLRKTALDYIKNVKEKYVLLYCSGLTSATIEVMNACTVYKKKIALMHFNTDTGSYSFQEVLYNE